MIELKGVNKVYGKGDGAVHALRDANVIIEDGKFTAILGKSGSGKSTLMNIIGALDSPTSGTVEANGQVLNELNHNQLSEYRNRTTGFIFQSFYLEPTFTVLDNVAMPLIISGMSRKEREGKALKILADVGLTDKAYKKANELSGGQKQRVSIARALVHNPDIVLADEPTGNLDSVNGAEVMKLLKQICDMGKSVVLVTHNMEDAKNAHNIIHIVDGVCTVHNGEGVAALDAKLAASTASLAFAATKAAPNAATKAAPNAATKATPNAATKATPNSAEVKAEDL